MTGLLPVRHPQNWSTFQILWETFNRIKIGFFTSRCLACCHLYIVRVPIVLGHLFLFSPPPRKLFTYRRNCRINYRRQTMDASSWCDLHRLYWGLVWERAYIGARNVIRHMQHLRYSSVASLYQDRSPSCSSSSCRLGDLCREGDLLEYSS